ncbi:hypothetical protein H0266_11535 [Halobacillus locisalis]|uniref:Uncharacterized protein n=1 Tax=Halobacillus locisalis TaxID=220753 RepID=A0A838CUT8_9BACI|nr:hypothetical protein [Halobacillus locisalis]MBA2175525.1 hypothetical protein [Halobacillus locisalis]
MFYLLFALFFLGYFLVGSLTDLVELSPVASIISVVFVFANVYLFFKSKKEEKKDE